MIRLLAEVSDKAGDLRTKFTELKEAHGALDAAAATSETDHKGR